MKKHEILTISLALLTVLGANAQGRKAFHKYCVVTSVTGGPGKALYATRASDGEKINSEILDSNIDPLITEYGLTDKIGLGLTRGSDNFSVNTNKFYKQNIPTEVSEHMMATSTKYITFDISYHYFTTKRFDFSVFGSAGYYKLSGATYNTTLESDQMESLFSYNARGGIIRTGARARWYFSKRWGVMAMIYGYKGYVKEPNRVNPISDGKNSGGISTTLTGGGFEFGICVRIGKQRNVQAEAPKEKKKRRKKIDEENYDKVPLFSFVWD